MTIATLGDLDAELKQLRRDGSQLLLSLTNIPTTEQWSATLTRYPEAGGFRSGHGIAALPSDAIINALEDLTVNGGR